MYGLISHGAKNTNISFILFFLFCSFFPLKTHICEFKIVVFMDDGGVVDLQLKLDSGRLSLFIQIIDYTTFAPTM